MTYYTRESPKKALCKNKEAPVALQARLNQMPAMSFHEGDLHY